MQKVLSTQDLRRLFTQPILEPVQWRALFDAISVFREVWITDTQLKIIEDHRNSVLMFNAATDIVVTLPPDLGAGFCFGYCQYGKGLVRLRGNIISADTQKTSEFVSYGQYSSGSAGLLSTGEWILS